MSNHGESECLRRLLKAGYLVQKIPTPHRIVKGKVVYTSSPGVDIMGTTPTGQSILVEAKTTAGLHLPIDPRLESQLAYLELHAALGAITMLYWNGVFALTSGLSDARLGQSFRWDLFASCAVKI